MVEKSARAGEFYAQLRRMLQALERGVANIEAANEAREREQRQRHAAEDERKRKEAEARDARRRQEEAAREAARVMEEFRFG